MISNFPAKQHYNLGGYKNFLFLPDYAVLSYPMISNAKTLVPLGITSGYSWLSGYATAETLQLIVTPANVGNGVYYDISLEGFVPGENSQLIDQLAQMERVRFLAIATDTNNQMRLIGSPPEPLTFLATYNSGALRTDQKGFNISFTGQSLYRPPIYMP